MADIFEGQTNIDIEITSFVDLTDAASTVVYFKSPSNKEYTLSGTVTDVAKGKVEASLPATTDIFGKAGNWAIWLQVLFNDGRTGIGETTKIRVKPVGT